MAYLKTAAVETEPVGDASIDLDTAAISADPISTAVDESLTAPTDRSHTENYLDQLRERNEQIENSQIFGADLLLTSTSLSHTAANRSSEQRLQAELANQEGNALSTTTSKKKKGASGLASIDVVVQQLEAVVPQEQIEALAKALKEAQDQQGTNQQVSSAQLLNMVQEIARALKGNDTLLTLHNNGLTTEEAVTALLSAHIDDEQIVTAATQQIVQAIEAPPLSLGLDQESLTEAIQIALEQNRAQDVRALILSTGISPEEFLAREVRKGNFETLRALMDAGVFTTQETVTLLYAEGQSLYEERGALLGNRAAIEQSPERGERLAELNRQIGMLEEQFSDVLQGGVLGQQITDGFRRAETAARTEVMLARAGELGRAAGLHAELRSSRGVENSLNSFIQNEHGAFLEANPEIAALVTTHVQASREAGKRDYQRVRETNTELIAALREDYPENRVHELLGRLDYDEMRIFLQVHDQATGRHLTETLRREFGEDSAVFDAYHAAYQRRHHPALPAGADIQQAVGPAALAVGTVVQESQGLALTARPIDPATRAAGVQQMVATFRTDTVEAVDRLIERARERHDYLPLAQMRAQMSTEQWQAFEVAYQAEKGSSLSAQIEALPQSEVAALVLRDAQAVVLANALKREMSVENVSPDVAFTNFSRLRTPEQVNRAVEAYRIVNGVSALAEVQQRAALLSSSDLTDKIDAEVAAVRADAIASTLTTTEELQVLSRLELGTLDPRELQAIQQQDELTVAVFAVDRALRSQDPIVNTYALTGGVDPATSPEFLVHYEQLMGHTYRSPEQVVMERAQAEFSELARKQARFAQGNVTNAMTLEDQHAEMSGIGLTNFWSMVSGTRAEISEAADAHWRESERQFNRANDLQRQLGQSRELGQQAMQLLEQSRQMSSAGNQAEAQELRIQANALMRNSLGYLGDRRLMVVSDEMRQDMQRFSRGLDQSIGALNDYERYLRTTRTVVIVGGAIIATGGLASGAVAPGALGGVFTALGGGKVAAVTLGTLGVTAAGAVGNVTEQTLNVGYGNATVGEAFDNLGAQTYSDFKTSAIASTSVVVGLGTASRVGTLLQGTRLAGTQTATLLTAGSAGASGSMFSTAADMSATNLFEGGREVMNENGEIVRRRFTFGEITSSTAHSGVVGFLSGGIGGKAELMRGAATTGFGRAMIHTGEAVLTTGVGLGSSAVQGDLSADNIISEVGFAGVGVIQGHMAVRQQQNVNGRSQSNSALGGELRAQVEQRIDQTIHDAAESRRVADGRYLDAGHEPTLHDRVEARVDSNRGGAEVRATGETIRSVERALEGINTVEPALRETALAAATAETEYRMAQQDRILRIRETVRQALRVPFGDFANRIQEVGSQIRSLAEANTRLQEVAARTQEVRQRLVAEANVARTTEARTLSPEMRAVAEQKSRLEESRAQARRTLVQEVFAPIADGRAPSLSTMRRALVDSFSGTRLSEVGAQVQRQFREARAQAADRLAVQADAAQLGSRLPADQATPVSQRLDEAALKYAEARRGVREGVGALFRELTAPVDMHRPTIERLGAAWQRIQEGLPLTQQRRAAAQEYRQARANFGLEQRIARSAEALGPREGSGVTAEVETALRDSALRLAQVREVNRLQLAFWRPKPQVEVVLGVEGAARTSSSDLRAARQQYRSAHGAYSDQRLEQRVTERLSPGEESQHADAVRAAAQARAQDAVGRRQGYRALANEFLAPFRDGRAPSLSAALDGVSQVASHTRLAREARAHALQYFDARGEHRADLTRDRAEASRHQEPTGGRETLAVERANHFASVLADHARSIRQDLHRVVQEVRNVFYLERPSLPRIVSAEVDVPRHTRLNSEVREMRRGYNESRVTVEADRARTNSLAEQRIEASPEEVQQLSRRAQRAMGSSQELAGRVAEHAAERRRGYLQMRQEVLSFLELRAPDLARLRDGFDAVLTNSSVNRSVSETLRAANRDRAVVTGELQSLRRRSELGWRQVDGADDSTLARRQRNLNVEALRVATTEGSFRGHADAIVNQLKDPLSLFTRDGLRDIGSHLAGLYGTSSVSRSVRIERGRLHYAQALHQAEANYQTNRQTLVQDATVSNRQVAADVRAQNMRLGDEGRAESQRAWRGIFREQRLGAVRELVSGVIDRFQASPLSSTGFRARHLYAFVQYERGLVQLARGYGIQIRMPAGASDAPSVRLADHEESGDEETTSSTARASVVEVAPRETPLLRAADDGVGVESGVTRPPPIDARVAAIDERLRVERAQLDYERGLLGRADSDGNIDLGDGVQAPRAAIEEGVRSREQTIESLLQDRARAETFALQDRIMQERASRPEPEAVPERTPQEELSSLTGRIEGIRKILADQQRHLEAGSVPEVELAAGRRMTSEELASWHEETRQELVDLMRQREMLEARIETPRENPLQPNDPAWRAYQEASMAEVRAQAQRAEARMREIAQQVMRGPSPQPIESSARESVPHVDTTLVSRRAEFAAQLADLRSSARDYEVWLQNQEAAARSRNEDVTVFTDELELLATRRRAFDEVATAGRTAQDATRFDELAQEIQKHTLMLQNNREVLESGFLVQDAPREGAAEANRASDSDENFEGWIDSYNDDEPDFDGFSSDWSPDNDGPGGGGGFLGGGGAGRAATAVLDPSVRTRPTESAPRSAPQSDGILRMTPDTSPEAAGMSRLDTQNRAVELEPRVVENETEIDPLLQLMEEPRIAVAEPAPAPRPQFATRTEQADMSQGVAVLDRNPELDQLFQQIREQQLAQLLNPVESDVTATPRTQETETMRDVVVLDRNPELDGLFQQLGEYELQQLVAPVEIEAPSRTIEIDGRPYVLNPATDDVDVITQRVNQVELEVQTEQRIAVRVRPSPSHDVREDVDPRDELDPRYRPEHEPAPSRIRAAVRPFDDDTEQQRRRRGELDRAAVEEEKRRREGDDYKSKLVEITKADYERNKGGEFSAGLKKRVKNPVIIGEQRDNDYIGNDMNDPSRYHDEWVDT